MDYTGDIQTATVLLVVGRCFMKDQSWPITYSAEGVASSDFELLATEDNEACNELDEHMRRSCTIVCDYLDMLNTWGMWVQRARLDCILGWRRDMISVEPRMNQNAVQASVFLLEIFLYAYLYNCFCTCNLVFRLKFVVSFVHRISH